MKQAEERKLNPRPSPKIVIVKKASLYLNPSVIESGKTLPPPRVTTNIEASEKDAILKDLWEQIKTIKNDRGKLSSRTAYLVEDIFERLKGNPILLEDLRVGRAALPELKEHYEKIQALTDQATKVWDNIQYVERYGKLPVEPEAQGLKDISEEESVLKYQIRRLDDFIYKKKNNIEKKVPKNPSRLAVWKAELQQAEAQRDELKLKLKELQYGTRK